MRNLTIGGFIERLQRYDPEAPCCGAVWLADDFLDMDASLTPAEIQTAVWRANKWYDADIGYSWDFLRDIVDDVIDERE